MSSLLRHLKFTLLVFALAGLASACNSAPQKQVITVNLTSYKIDMSATTVKAGEVTFVVKNVADDQIHEFIIVRTDTKADALEVVAATNRIDEDDLDALGEVADLEVSLQQELTLTLEPGHYVMLCNLASHYTSGMFVDFTVTR